MMRVHAVPEKNLKSAMGHLNLSMLKLGKYKHYKGKDYEVIGIAKLEETLEDMVVYRL